MLGGQLFCLSNCGKRDTHILIHTNYTNEIKQKILYFVSFACISILVSHYAYEIFTGRENKYVAVI